jgi:hypothetical protein
MAVASIFFLLRPNQKKRCNEYSKKTLSISFNGVVIRKYIDKKQHYSRIILIQSDDTIPFAVTYDKSGLFNYIYLQDSIVKEYGENMVVVYRDNERDSTFNLDFGCVD